MSNKWTPGSDEFSPSKMAAGIKAEVISGDEGVRHQFAYHREYLAVTAGRDGNSASVMEDGTRVYWSPQASTQAAFFAAVYGMAVALASADDSERMAAEREWRSTDWDAMWESLKAAV